MNKKEGKSRNYCFTINNYSEKDLKRFHVLAESLEKHRYICYGLEVAPSTGTKHIQGYVELSIAQRLTFLHNYFNFKKGKQLLKFHIDIANGNAEQNKKYVSKDGKFFEYGEPQTQGSRNDLRQIKEAVKESPSELPRIIDELANNGQQLRYAENLAKYYLPNRNPKFPPNVIWIFGSTGIGKTSLVYKTFTDVCSVSSYEWLGTGYNQNECFLLDDFREFSLTFDQVLKITDRYPFMLFYKGSQTPLNSPFIIFTSPKCIDDTFRNTKEDMKQLHRRMIEIDLDSIENLNDIDLRNLDEKYIYKGVNYPKDDF
jgi:hypothetical protein